MAKYYVVMDSRAQYSFDDASIVEAVGHKKPSNVYLEQYEEMGYCLVVYQEHKGELSNPQLVKVI